jgi:hypothetical protein
MVDTKAVVVCNGVGQGQNCRFIEFLDVAALGTDQMVMVRRAAPDIG